MIELKKIRKLFKSGNMNLATLPSELALAPLANSSLSLELLKPIPGPPAFLEPTTSARAARKHARLKTCNSESPY